MTVHCCFSDFIHTSAHMLARSINYIRRVSSSECNFNTPSPNFPCTFHPCSNSVLNLGYVFLQTSLYFPRHSCILFPTKDPLLADIFPAFAGFVHNKQTITNPCYHFCRELLSMPTCSLARLQTRSGRDTQ